MYQGICVVLVFSYGKIPYKSTSGAPLEWVQRVRLHPLLFNGIFQPHNIHWTTWRLAKWFWSCFRVLTILYSTWFALKNKCYPSTCKTELRGGVIILFQKLWGNLLAFFAVGGSINHWTMKKKNIVINCSGGMFSCQVNNDGPPLIIQNT